MRLQVQDQVHGRERLAGDGGRTDLRAASAAHAGVQLEQLLPGEVLNLPDPEDFLLLDVFDLREPAGCVGAQEEGVHRREDHVVQPREDDEPQPAERQHDVGPPAPRMQGQHLTLVEPEQVEELREPPRDERPPRPVRVRVQFGRVDAERLHQEAREQHQAEPQDDRVVLDPLVPANAVEIVEVAPIQRHADADQPDQPEEVAVEGEEQVVAAGEEADAQIIVDRHLRRDQRQHHDRGEDAHVHDPRVAVAPDLLLPQPQPHRVAHPRGHLAEQPGRRLADRPQRRMAAEAVNEQPDQRGEEDVDHPRVVYVEEDLAACRSTVDLERRNQPEPRETDGGTPPCANEARPQRALPSHDRLSGAAGRRCLGGRCLGRAVRLTLAHRLPRPSQLTRSQLSARAISARASLL